MTLEEVRSYLRIDHYEDDSYIQFLIDASESFLFSITGKLDKNSNLYNELISNGNEVRFYTNQQIKLSELYRMAMICEMYDNRGLTVDKAEEKVRLIYNSILTHLIYS